MGEKGEKDDDYQKKLREFIDKDRERTARRHKDGEVKLSALKVRMPMGCWILVLLLGVLAYLVLRWILRNNPTILS